MVAKKTAQQSASGRSRGSGASVGMAEDVKDVNGMPSTHAAPTAAKTTKTTKTKPKTTKPAVKPTSKRAAEKPGPEETPAKDTPHAGTRAKATGGKKTPKTSARQPASGARAPKATAPRAAAPKATASGATAPEAAAKGAAGTPERGGEGAGVGRKSTGKKAGAARAAKQTGATTVVAKKTPGTATAATTAVPKARVAAAVEPGDLAVRPGEDPWTPEEVAEARAELQSEMERLRTEISSSEASLAGLMRDSGDGAGDDQADTGAKNITREHEMALAANAREMLVQTERALDRLDAGTYGLCENCGNPIGKARMQAFPRATLCVECKQKQERRY
ncbi:DNA-binding protein [Streptomyces spiralis]|uniref:DNA-binding protein n=1 Tax=Streptomyces spiralis TaxID=66376 RepID=A0A919AEK0_9ACTN|nr:TraR/DksA family transcriptional regulator [Streptomyces spiralis]GHF01171.1 DNA-binding protein [Streptomyces spiralis]